MKRNLVVGSLILVLACGLSLASDRWLHVRVQDDGPNGEKVSVNVPISLVEAILPTIDVDEMHGGRVQLDGELEGIDLRELFQALQDSPDTNFVTVQGDDENVRVAKENGFLVVHVDERRGDKVRVTMPLEVVDAMLVDGGDEIDLLAGLRALAEYDGDLVTVEGDDEHVRIWIDSSESGE